MVDTVEKFRSAFLKRMSPDRSLADLFDHLPDVYFFLKTADSRFVKINRAMCRLHGLDNDRSVVGKTDHDYYPVELADRYVAEDQRIMKSGKALPNQVWLVPTAEGELRWYLSSKMPVFDRTGRVIGIAGAMRDYERAGAVLEPYQEMAAVIAHVAERYEDRITVGELAAIAHLSVSQFERRFKALFQMTPTAYIEQVRIHAACTALVSTRDPIASIGDRCGFYDQSHFTRRFRRAMGLTPRVYRMRYSRAE